MSVEINLPEMHPVSGFKLATVCAGIKATDKKDVVLMSFGTQAHVAGVFTQNAFCAAPVHIAKEHLQKNSVQYFVINTGNANAGTGEQGIQDALLTCDKLSKLTHTENHAVLPFSTGVIGETLPVDKIIQALPEALDNLSEQGWQDAAQGILTTDTCTKGASTRVMIAGKWVTITGIAKGSGMIRPDMATMLGFVATDAAIEQSLLRILLKYAVDHSFNRITVDGDTSTNDSCMLVATGYAKMDMIHSEEQSDYVLLRSAITDVFEKLAKAIILDGEGATKLIHIQVSGGLSEQECNQVAYTIAHSPLVKTAFFASDPNWGRILAAVGRSGLPQLDINALEIFLDEVCIVNNGGRALEYTEEQGQSVMNKDEITINVQLHRGDASVQIWTCDLSYDYVKINAEYRT